MKWERVVPYDLAAKTVGFISLEAENASVTVSIEKKSSSWHKASQHEINLQSVEGEGTTITFRFQKL